MTQFNLISHDYFQTMGLQMRAGRPFATQDGPEAPQVAIIFAIRRAHRTQMSR
jgi:hypothetical protein